ncbi:hypothetical protein [Actinoplanes sp. L3-i22]|uniref:hypothetical protein n=1 Tax=Actinoplanes sp. L3-i22 TaxID=2836373 RepID=UPI001C790144|nr:hypothetical protein [Actinoplanes sp. L3-i22]BCY07144.1 hypothetical protein L3i22_022320 [Actinoplanes sp. L3-i22]
MSLPPVDPAVTAEAVAALPARLRKRLDEAVPQAAAWPVESAGDVVTVRPDDQVTITLKVPVLVPDDAVCGCLLAPRCLHRAAVLSAAPVHTGEPVPEEPSTAGATTTVEPTVSAVQEAAADTLWSAAAAVLANGIPGAGAIAQADLLRAVHQARATGLHGPAAAAIRVVERLRAARREDPAFHLADLTDDLREVLAACHRIKTGDGTAMGTARRDYEPVGDLRLYGLFCEPVRAATGHAGAATYLADATGRLWVVSDVRPADQPATAAAVRTSVDLGEVRLNHHALARAGLHAINAHASAAGRLSHGRARQAVTASGATWFEAPLDALWQTGPGAQAARWLTAAALPAGDRPMAHDLAFLDGTVLGADPHGLLLAIDEQSTGRGLTIAVAAPHEDPALPYVGNLRLLATQAAGRRIRLIGRFTGPRRVDGLAFAAAWLGPAHGGHVDLGATTLIRADLDAPTATPPPGQPSASAEPPPLHLLRHQVERVAAAGRAVLLSGVDADARRLAAAHLVTASTVLTGLGAAGRQRTRDVFGRLDPHDTHRLAQAWLTAAVYEHAARRDTTRQAWTCVDTNH